MSPFFRGNVRPAKKHPRTWSLNPRLNPDLEVLGKDNTRLSILGLPTQETDVTLPVFNNVYTKPSLDDLKEPVVYTVNGDSHPEPIPEETTTEEVHGPATAETDRPAPVPAVAETTHVPEPIDSAALSTIDTHANERQPADASTEARHVEGEPAVEAPVPENVKATISPKSAEPVPVSTTPANVENWPLPAALPTTNGLIGKGSSEDTFDESAGPDTITADDTVPPAETAEVKSVQTDAVPAEESALAAETEPHRDVVEAPSSDPVGSAAGYESAEAEVTHEMFAGAGHVEEHPVEHLATIDEEVPAAESEEPVVSRPEPVEAHEEYALSGLEVIKEEEPATGGTEPLSTGEDPATLRHDEKSEPWANNNSNNTPEIAEGSAPAQAIFHGEEPTAAEEQGAAAATPRTPAVDEMPSVTEDTADNEQASAQDESAAEGPSIPRHSEAEQPPAGEYTTRSNRDSVAISSVESSVGMNEEPLVTDEQLEVSDEFKPGVRMYSVETPH